jgi:P63C domain
MANSIVSSLSPEELLNLFRKEAKISKDGSVWFTRRGVSRLTRKGIATISSLLIKIKGEPKLDVIDPWKGSDINKEAGFGSVPVLSKKTKYDKPLSKPLKPFSGMDFTGKEGIPEILVSAILAHYDKLGSVQCEDLRLMFDSVGLRQSVHIAQNWETNQSQADRVAYRYLLPEPRNWDKQFSDEFYEQLERLTKIQLKGSHRPHLWAQLTNEFVYDYLPSEVAEGVRMAKAENATTDKLHQFLSVEGLDLLQKHLNALTILMTGVSSVEELRKVSIGRFAGQYQQALILK